MSDARRHAEWPDQGECQGHEHFKVRNCTIFKIYLHHLRWELANDHWFHVLSCFYIFTSSWILRSVMNAGWRRLTAGHTFGRVRGVHFCSLCSFRRRCCLWNSQMTLGRWGGCRSRWPQTGVLTACYRLSGNRQPFVCDTRQWQAPQSCSWR